MFGCEDVLWVILIVDNAYKEAQINVLRRSYHLDVAKLNNFGWDSFGLRGKVEWLSFVDLFFQILGD
ncbi:MAG: hypothetical protein KDD45_11390 [Bdellovibrionales bacterium]|nr:hypothetical protein [Bdellovibrionales bacterium]